MTAKDKMRNPNIDVVLTSFDRLLAILGNYFRKLRIIENRCRFMTKPLRQLDNLITLDLELKIRRIGLDTLEGF